MSRRWPSDIVRLKIDDLVVDIRLRRIVYPDGEVDLPQRVFDLLLVFMAAPGVLHSRTELFESVWSGVIVEDASVTQTVWMLRRALGPERKHWIRTVAKNGYVFDPPTEVVSETSAIVAESSPDTWAEPIAALPATAPRMALPADMHRTALRKEKGLRTSVAAFWRMAAAVLLACSMALIQASDSRLRSDPFGQDAPVQSPRAAIAVAVIGLQGPANNSRLRWPVVLLTDWLRFKLEHLPEVVLMKEEDLSADAFPAPPHLVLLTIGRSSSDSDQIVLRATFDAVPQTLRIRRNDRRESPARSGIEIRGPADRIPSMIDALSQQVIERIVPHRAQSPWPQLTLDTEAAQGYAEAIESIDRRDWSAALAQAEAVVKMAPDFGLVRMRLAEVLSHQGQPGRAIEQMAVAKRLMTPIPDDARQLFDALGLSMDRRQPAQAAEAYSALSALYPARSDFALKKAKYMTTSGRAEEAMAILSAESWDRLSLSVRIEQQMELGRAALALGYAADARRNALEAERLIRDAGDGWNMQLGDARFLFASAYHSEFPQQPLPRLYERAARTFDTGGYRLGALYSRFMAETLRPASQPAGGISMPVLLAEARATGHRGLEFEILVQMAYKAYDSGLPTEYRTLIGEAESVAKLAGDPVGQQTVDFSLLQEDYLTGDFAGVDLRIARLLQADLSGDAAFVAAHSDASLAMLRGRYRHAMDALRRGERAATADGALPRTPMTAGGADCLRTELFLRTGDLAAARTEWSKCRRSSIEDLRITALLTGAALELASANRPQAIDLLADADVRIAQLADGPARWEFGLQAATLQTRAGLAAQAERAYLDILPKVERAGYAWLAANAETGLAETAAVRRDWAASRDRAAAARRRPAAKIWTLRSRLDQIDIAHAVLAPKQGSARARAIALSAEARQRDDILVHAPLAVLSRDPVSRSASGPAGNAASAGYAGGLDWLLSRE
jgi:cellulose synthase operon protein C